MNLLPIDLRHNQLQLQICIEGAKGGVKNKFFVFCKFIFVDVLLLFFVQKMDDREIGTYWRID